MLSVSPAMLKGCKFVATLPFCILNCQLHPCMLNGVIVCTDRICGQLCEQIVRHRFQRDWKGLRKSKMRLSSFSQASAINICTEAADNSTAYCCAFCTKLIEASRMQCGAAGPVCALEADQMWLLLTSACPHRHMGAQHT